MIQKLKSYKEKRIMKKVIGKKQNGVTKMDLAAISDEQFERVRGRFGKEQAPPYYQENPIRIVFVDDYCEFCRMWRKVIPRINNKLAYWAEPIKIVNVANEGYRTELDYKQTNLTPELFLDGIMVKGITSEAYAEGFLREYLKDEIIVEA